MSERTFLHVDMDAFFAAVEQLDNPELLGRPVVVGAPPDRRGVVCTCSYEARVFGVHSAMPSRTAYRLCPHAVFLPVRGKRYGEISRQVFEIFRQYSPFVEKLSIDEAFLDITGSMHLFGGPVDTADRVREQIKSDLGLTASVGLAPNKFLAKLASDMDKPDGLTIVPRDPGEIETFLAPLPIRRIWGVGKVTGKRLNDFGFQTIGDLQLRSESELQQILGLRSGSHIYRLSHGIDKREIAGHVPEKSISHEHTYADDCRDWDLVEQTVLRLAEKVGSRLRKAGKVAATAHIKLRWSSFDTITRQLRLSPPAHTDHELIDAALKLLHREKRSRAVRLVGFGVSALYDPEGQPAYQPDLFAPDAGSKAGKFAQLDSAVDTIRQRFGEGSLKRGKWDTKRSDT